MNVKKNPLDAYKRFLLNRASSSTPFVEFLEHCLIAEEEAAHHCFHKVMVHGWTEPIINLFECLSDYFTSSFIPVQATTQCGISSFYTSSLSFINKIIRYDFMFPYQQNMFNIDVLFNDKSSVELFDNTVTIEDIVSSVVSRRFTGNSQLDLSNFCKDQDFIDKRIYFYKITLLAHFKILMLRMGRDTKALNLSNNNLSQPPIDILNFFIKGDLTSINLSDNNITSISDLFRVSSKIETLWVEGNPLCDDIEPGQYAKNIIMKFPRLSELDGLKINATGLAIPFRRNFLAQPNQMTKMLIERFLTLYFSHYDTPKRPDIHGFYGPQSTFTMTIDFEFSKLSREPGLSVYVDNARNILTPKLLDVNPSRVYLGRSHIQTLFSILPTTVHDPSTFTVDVLHHDKLMVCVVVTGMCLESPKARLFHFRRTFTLSCAPAQRSWPLEIANEMLHLCAATPEQSDNSFKNPVRNHNSLTLVNPERDESEAIVKIFTHITQLKKEEAEIRLRLHRWDMKEALQELIEDIQKNNILYESFTFASSVPRDEDELSDMSTLMDDDEID